MSDPTQPDKPAPPAPSSPPAPDAAPAAPGTTGPASHGADDTSAPDVKPYGQTGTTGVATPVSGSQSVLDGTGVEVVEPTAVTGPPSEEASPTPEKPAPPPQLVPDPAVAATPPAPGAAMPVAAATEAAIPVVEKPVVEKPAVQKPAPPPKVEAAPPAPEPPIIGQLKEMFTDGIVDAAVVDGKPTFVVDRQRMVEFAMAVRMLGFDYPGCISGVDWPDPKAPENSYRETVYHLRNMQTGEWLVLKARCPSADPWLNSLYIVYRGVDWNEREVYDLFGIEFRGHPDLRRILMPEDWTGHPLLKSYRMSTYYSPAGNERQK